MYLAFFHTNKNKVNTATRTIFFITVWIHLLT